MTITSLLKVGRAIGSENFSQFKNLARAITKNAPTGRAHFVLDKSMTDSLAKLPGVKITDEARKFQKICDYYNPKASEKGVKTIYDIVFNRYGAKSGTVLLKGKSMTPKDGVYSTLNLKGLVNNAGGRVYCNASMPSIHMNTNADIAILNKGVAKKDRLDLLAKSIEYNTANGVSYLNINPISANGGKGHMSVQAPTGLFNDITRVFTDYKFMSFDEALKGLIQKH